MKRRVALREWVLALAMLLPGPVFATGFGCAPLPALDAPAPNTRQSRQMGEIIGMPGQPARQARNLGAWLKRLEGQYTYEGHIQPCNQARAADRRPVTGKADCILDVPEPVEAPARSVYCLVDVRWSPVRGKDGASMPGSESDLSSAVLIYAVSPELPQIQHLRIDNKGATTHAIGRLTGDTLVTREPCGVPGPCQRVTRITARPNGREISMLVDFEIESRPVLRQAFLLRRVSALPARKDR